MINRSLKRPIISWLCQAAEPSELQAKIEKKLQRGNFFKWLFALRALVTLRVLVGFAVIMAFGVSYPSGVIKLRCY
jgi:hypothetical protein